MLARPMGIAASDKSIESPPPPHSGGGGVRGKKTALLKHECGRIDRSHFLDYKWIVSHYTDSFHFTRRFFAADVMTTIKQNHILQVSRSQVYRAKKRAEN